MADFELVCARLDTLSGYQDFILALDVFEALPEEDKLTEVARASLLAVFEKSVHAFYSHIYDCFVNHDFKPYPRQIIVDAAYEPIKPFVPRFEENKKYLGEHLTEVEAMVQKMLNYFREHAKEPQLMDFEESLEQFGRFSFFEWDSWPNPPKFEDWIHLEMSSLVKSAGRLRARLDKFKDEELKERSETQLRELIASHFDEALSDGGVEEMCALWLELCPEKVEKSTDDLRMEELRKMFASKVEESSDELFGDTILARSGLRVKQARLAALVLERNEWFSEALSAALRDYDPVFGEFLGSSEMKLNGEESTAFSVLGLPADATLQQVRAAFKKIALETHPDKQGPELSAERKAELVQSFLAAREAYEYLLGLREKDFQASR